MLTRIGIIYQDSTSLGFLRGLRDRLDCKAELIGPPTAMGKNRRLPWKSAKLAWRSFQKKNVDLVVRFTDADRSRWQQVRRQELKIVPPEAGSLWVCGVAVNNPEEWLALDLDYLARVLEVPRADLDNSVQRTGRIKHAISRLGRAGDGVSNLVAGIVRDAPPEVFRRWLEDESLQTFYEDCRAAAKRANCETPNELEAPG